MTQLTPGASERDARSTEASGSNAALSSSPSSIKEAPNPVGTKAKALPQTEEFFCLSGGGTLSSHGQDHGGTVTRRGTGAQAASW